MKSLDLSTTSPGFDFFLAVHSHNFFADMATSTNAYAAMHGGRLWLDTTDDKMHFFFGILILTGVNRDYRSATKLPIHQRPDHSKQV